MARKKKVQGPDRVKPVGLLVLVPPSFKGVLEARRRALGYRTVAEVVRERIGCPQPESTEWDRMLEQSEIS